MKKLFRFVLVLILLGISGFGAYHYLWRANDPMKGQKSDYQVLAHEWVEEFKINEQAANQKYADRIVEAKGVVRDVLTDSLGGLSQAELLRAVQMVLGTSFSFMVLLEL